MLHPSFIQEYYLPISQSSMRFSALITIFHVTYNLTEKCHHFFHILQFKKFLNKMWYSRLICTNMVFNIFITFHHYQRPDAWDCYLSCEQFQDSLYHLKDMKLNVHFHIPFLNNKYKSVNKFQRNLKTEFFKFVYSELIYNKNRNTMSSKFCY